MIDEQAAWQEMQSTAQMAHVSARLSWLMQALAELPDWQPAQPLLAQGAWLETYLAQLAARWQQKLVVALVGPSGAGKSSLLNRLVGADVSPTGLTRPTTRQVFASAAEEADVAGLSAWLGDEALRFVPQRDALPSGGQQSDGLLNAVILLDTPDTNTLPENRQLLSRLLEQVDLVVPVFSALNPKLEDNIAYLRPFMQRLPREAILPVLNMVDRVPEDQLLHDVLPDWRQALARSWELAPDHPVLMTQALAQHGAPSRADDENPLHAIDQFETLRQTLTDSAARQDQAQTQRLSQAEHLLARFEAQVAVTIAQSETARTLASDALDELHAQSLQTLRAWRQGQPSRPPVAQSAALVGLVSQRLVGPLSWLMLLWTLGVRLAELLGQVWQRGLRSLWQRTESGEYIASWALSMGAQLGQALDQALAQAWPPVGDALAAAGFISARARIGSETSTDQQTRALLCQSTADEMLEALAEALTRWPLQLLFNLPIMGLVGWVAWDAVGGFVARQFLPPGYFEHALVALLTVWALAFALYQVMLGVALRASFRRHVQRQVLDTLLSRHTRDYEQALERIEALRRELG